MKRSLALPPEAASVKRARAWITDELTALARPDLIYCARLGTTELVTNALIHGTPPMSVNLRGTRDHPWIEVVDGSPLPPRPHPDPRDEASEAEDPATFGHGLDLVAMSSARWGAEWAGPGIKSVWFEPAAALGEVSRPGLLYAEGPEPTDSTRSIRIRLRRTPVAALVQVRQHLFELRREMRLLALADPERYPIAVELTELFRLGQAHRRAGDGFNALDEANRDDVEVVDLEYVVPREAIPAMARTRVVLSTVYEEFAAEHLLTLTPPSPTREVLDWFYEEFARQGRGEEPSPWPGFTESTVEGPSASASS